MNNIKEIFQQAEDFFQNIDLDKSHQIFNSLKKIIADPMATKEDISDAYLLQGILVSILPFLNEYDDDDLGTVYFHQAIQHNSNNISALLNIVGNFSPIGRYTPYMVENPSIFLQAYEKLQNELYHQLNKLQIQTLVKSDKTYKKLKQNYH